ncbi:MAG: head GIN domain-containing protein [Sphingomonadaceae bacterium]
MRSLIPFAVVLIASAPALGAERTWNLAGFDGVSLGGSSRVVVTTGKAHSVRAEGSQGDLDRLDIRLEGKTLRIGAKPGSWNWSTQRPVIHVTMPAITAAAVAGSGDLRVDRAEGSSFNGKVSGSGDLVLDSVKTGTLDLAVSGSGSVRAAGSCSALNAAVSGSGDLRMADLTCATANIAVRGSGNAAVQATGTANLVGSGSGDIRVTGGARCTVTKSGSGRIDCG